MPAQRFEDARLTAASPSPLAPRLRMNRYAASPMRIQDLRSGTVWPENEWPPEAIVDLRLLARGVRWALAIEAAAALCAYAAWSLWRLWF